MSSVNLTMGIDVPRFPDACHDQGLTAANCTYDLAAGALASHLITHTPFTFANVTFSGAVGTQGLPIGAMQHFASVGTQSRFGHEMSGYCLPVLEPSHVTCTPIDTEERVQYVYITTRYDPFLKVDLDTYEVTHNPGTDYNQTYVLTSSAFGVMSISRSKRPQDTSVTVLTGSGQYADLLSQLTTRTPLIYDNATYNQTHFTVLCDAPYTSSIYTWEWVSFTLTGGVMSAHTKNATSCANATERNPMGWLDYALENSAILFNFGDGYSKLLNTDFLATQGADYRRMQEYGMSPLEHIVNQIIAIVLTAWTATNAETAHTTSIQWREFQHRYIVAVEFTGVTIMALCVSCLVLLATIWQAWRWWRAVKALSNAKAGARYQLLDPLQLLAYGAMAGETVTQLRLNEEEQRIAVLRNAWHHAVLGSGPGTLLPVAAVEGDPFASPEDPRASGPTSRQYTSTTTLGMEQELQSLASGRVGSNAQSVQMTDSL